MKSPAPLTVVVCCHNSTPRLQPTLEHLARQTADPASWEIVVVDNASTDETSAFAAEAWECLGCAVPFSVVSESQPGLTHARRKGIESARYEVIGFVDDDNWLAPDWVATVQETMGNNPSIGILGTPNIEAVFESEPPPWAPLMLGTLACGSASFSGLAILKPGGIVAGAGMVIRRAAWQQVGYRYGDLQMRDRAGKETSSGGDIELCYVVGLLGWDIAQHGGLRMHHWLPASRFSEDYLVRLAKSNAVASNGLDPLRRLACGQIRRGDRFAISTMYFRQVVANICQVCLHFAKYLRSFSHPRRVADAIFLKGRLQQLAHIVFRASDYAHSAAAGFAVMGKQREQPRSLTNS